MLLIINKKPDKRTFMKCCKNEADQANEKQADGFGTRHGYE